MIDFVIPSEMAALPSPLCASAGGPCTNPLTGLLVGGRSKPRLSAQPSEGYSCCDKVYMIDVLHANAKSPETAMMMASSCHCSGRVSLAKPTVV